MAKLPFFGTTSQKKNNFVIGDISSLFNNMSQLPLSSRRFAAEINPGQYEILLEKIKNINALFNRDGEISIMDKILLTYYLR